MGGEQIGVLKGKRHSLRRSCPYPGQKQQVESGQGRVILGLGSPWPSPPWGLALHGPRGWPAPQLPLWRMWGAQWARMGMGAKPDFPSCFLPCSPPTPFMPFTSTLPLPPAPPGPSAPDAEDEEDYDS